MKRVIDVVSALDVISSFNLARIHEDALRRVEEFIDTFSVGEGISPEERVELWKRLVDEELEEVYSADSYENFAKEIADLYYVYAGLIIASRRAGVPVDAPQKAHEILYHCRMCFGGLLGAMVDEVHRSNMTKLGEDGKPIRRSDGKIMKGPDYRPADMSVFGAAIERIVSSFTGEDR